MSAKKIETILFIALIIITGGVYLYTVAPTLSFWDCGEFIASAYTLSVPHPPGTPFYVLLGRLWLMIFGLIAAVLPISKEVAWHMNLLSLGFSVAALALLYKLILRIARSFARNGNNEKTHIIAAFAACLALAFFRTYWENAVETEVYAASTFAFLLINYFGFLWYESVKNGTPKHHYIILSFYAIFLSTGIHLISFLMFVPFYVFVLIVERRYLKDLLFLLLGVFQLFLFSLTFIFPVSLYAVTLIIIGAILLAGIILPLNNRRKYGNWKFFWVSVLAIVAGLSAELYLPIRAAKLTELYKDPAVNEQYLAGKQIAPRINECNPGESFRDFDDVLHRRQYGPNRLPFPRQTQETTGYSTLVGYFWQMHLFFRYLYWQPAHEGVNRYFRAVILTLFSLFIAWGLVDLFRKEKRLFVFKIAILFMLSFAMVGYLNLKFSPSDPNPKHKPHEVRERDYFFHTGHVYFGMFMGLGFLAFLDWLKKETKGNRLARIGGTTGVLAFSVMPFFANLPISTRYGDFTPRDYGYNMLITCDDNSVLFTNGDNDTFPLWFAQEVLGIKRRVTVANLSLINTSWYIKQLKYWGVPISFSEFIIDRLEPVVTRDRRVIYVKDIMIRNIIATNAGVSLKNEDYFLTQEEFAELYIKGYQGKIPIYFATTVSEDNYRGFKPYLRLEGLVYRLVGESGNPASYVNAEKTRHMFYNTYRYTGIFGPGKQEFLSRILDDFDRRKKEGEFYDFDISYDENTRRLYSNYAMGLHQLGFAYQERGYISGTLDAWRFARMFEPFQSYFFDWNLALVFANLGIKDSVDHYLSLIDLKDPTMMIRIAHVYQSIEADENAIEYYRKAINMNPRMPQPYIGLHGLYLERYDTASAAQIISEWLRMNPADTSAMNLLRALKTQ